MDIQRFESICEAQAEVQFVAGYLEQSAKWYSRPLSQEEFSQLIGKLRHATAELKKLVVMECQPCER